MPTMQTNVEITENRRLQIDMELPKHMPIGRAHVEIEITPCSQKTAESPKSLMDFYGCFKGLNAFGGEGTEVQRKLRDEW